MLTDKENKLVFQQFRVTEVTVLFLDRYKVNLTSAKCQEKVMEVRRNILFFLCMSEKDALCRVLVMLSDTVRKHLCFCQHMHRYIHTSLIG